MGSGNGDFSDYAETTVDPGAAMSVTVVMVCIVLFCCLPKCIAWSAQFCCWETENDDSSVISTDEDASQTSRKSGIPVASPKETGAEKCPPGKESSKEEQQEGNSDDELKKVDIPIGDIENLSPKITKVATIEDSMLMDPPKIAASILQGKGSIRSKMPRQKHKPKLSAQTKSLGGVAASNREDDVSKFLDCRPALRLGRLRRASSKEQGDETQRDNDNKGDVAIHSRKKEAANDNAAINSFDSDDSDNDSELSALIDLTDLADGFDRFVKVAEWDKDMTRIWKTAKPFTTQAFIEGFIDLLSVGIIGHVFGVREANAYVVVMVLNKLTNFINYGFYEALGILLPEASDSGNEALAGEYLQVGIFLFTISSIPVILLWSLGTAEAIRWFGFDDETARIGQGYAYSFVLAEVVRGVDECLHVLLSFKGHDFYSTATHTLSHSTKPLAILLMFNKKDLAATGGLQLAMTVCMTIGNFMFVNHKGWLNDCWDGFVGRLAIVDGVVVEEMIRCAIPLSISWVLSYGEWELMVLFARFMGPAEVAAWGLLSILWSVCQLITEGFTIATELCVVTHMSNGAPKQAKITAYKAMILAVITSLIGTSFLFIFGEVLVACLSPDPTLQKMMHEVLPLLGFGNIALSFGGTCQAVLGSQGRHRLATFIKLLTTWIFVIPIALIMVYGANFNLLGIAGSLVMGYSLRGASNAFLIFSSDWNELAALMSNDTGDKPAQAVDDVEATEGGIPALSLTPSEIVAELKSTEEPAKSSAEPGVTTTTKTTTSTTKATKSVATATSRTKEENSEQLAPQEALPQQPLSQQHPPKSASMEEIDALMEERIRKFAAQLIANQNAGTIIPSSSTDLEGSKINFVIDTAQLSGEDVSYVTSLGGVEDKWTADDSDDEDEDEDDDDDEDEDEESESQSDAGTDSDQSTNNESASLKEASGWGFFSF